LPRTSQPSSERLAPNIVLIGLSGCGKSTVASCLAGLLGWTSIDTDVLIESKTRCAITEFFANFGEDEFRRVEADIVGQVMRGEKQVVATGGGAILLTANREELWERGFVVYLRTTPDALVARLTNQGADERPLLQGDVRDRLTSLLQARSKYYEQAHAVIDTDRASPDTVAEMIVKAYEHSS